MDPADAQPVAAACYADRAVARRTRIAAHQQLAPTIYRIRAECPELARRFVPGQFLMVRLPDCSDPLLGRPMAIYDTVLDEAGRPAGVEFVFLQLGKMTGRLARCAVGDELMLWGPLGNGFSLPAAQHLVMVAGGIGQTPFLALAKEALYVRRYGQPPRPAAQATRVTLCYGARTGELLAGVEDFQRAGVEVRLATDDGSLGHHGLVTDLLQDVLGRSGDACRVVCCGPEPMLQAASSVADRAGVPCEVSLETPMACGLGICFSCVTRVRQPGGGWDYKRTCVDGPVFDARQIVW